MLDLLDHLAVPLDTMVKPGICLDCSPVCLLAECPRDHGVGMETALMAAALSAQWVVVDLLLGRGANVDAANEVRSIVQNCGSCR